MFLFFWEYEKSVFAFQINICFCFKKTRKINKNSSIDPDSFSLPFFVWRQFRLVNFEHICYDANQYHFMPEPFLLKSFRAVQFMLDFYEFEDFSWI